MYQKILVLLLAYSFWHLTQHFLSTDIEAKYEIVDRLHDKRRYFNIMLGIR